MTAILTPLINEDITYKYSRLHEPFRFYSDVLRCEVEVPKGFVHDYESVPGLKGTSKRGGVAHDYLCRKDSIPIVTKSKAAAVYREIMAYVDSTKNRSWLGRLDAWWRRTVKSGFVAVCPGYFHRHTVRATFEEMSA